MSSGTTLAAILLSPDYWLSMHSLHCPTLRSLGPYPSFNYTYVTSSILDSRPFLPKNTTHGSREILRSRSPERWLGLGWQTICVSSGKSCLLLCFVCTKGHRLACLTRRLEEPKNNQQNTVQMSDFVFLLAV